MAHLRYLPGFQHSLIDVESAKTIASAPRTSFSENHPSYNCKAQYCLSRPLIEFSTFCQCTSMVPTLT
ncbi:hypothetical protein BS47DRAFT_1345200 [Hydnum rufescens UP504]|uniref:Uncharacterized protein n=1 Tax=Hydnum rufescens UP504 TaxID=1448309 RepID=A0A9P6AVC5_9AGAM|nr:hypothetical protein BS47DRAFT_1345200 [Hydnum rufescens UP504]